MPLDKVSIGAIVSLVVVVLAAFGIVIPEDISQEIINVAYGVIAIVAYFTTAYVVTERKSNITKLKTK